eukprot:11158514-Lingulodinium_polyedra.AAC.1
MGSTAASATDARSESIAGATHSAVCNLQHTAQRPINKAVCSLLSTASLEPGVQSRVQSLELRA